MGAFSATRNLFIVGATGFLLLLCAPRPAVGSFLTQYPEYSPVRSYVVNVVGEQVLNFPCPGDSNDPKHPLLVYLTEEGSSEAMCVAGIESGNIKKKLSPFIGKKVSIEAQALAANDENNHVGKTLLLIWMVDGHKIKRDDGGEGFLSKFVGVVSAISVATATAAGNPPDTTSVPNSSPAGGVTESAPALSVGTTQQSSSDRYGIPAKCIRTSTNTQGIAIFTNDCMARVSIFWANSTGHGDLTLGVGESGDGSMTNSSGGAKGTYSLYACSEPFVPVDEKNHLYITQPGVAFVCLHR